MTTIPIEPPPSFSLVSEVRAIRQIPDRTKRRAIRLRARLSQARVGRDVGVTPTRVSQWERIDELPITDKTLRYAALLAELEESHRETADVQK